MRWICLILCLIALITIVSADSGYCTPPAGKIVSIDHNGNWYNITIDTSPTCYVWQDAGYGDVIGTECDTTPPASITNLTCTPLSTCTGFTCTWVDPSDSDFNHIMAWLNEVFVGNVSAGIHSVTLNGLSLGTTYNISTRTVDTSGNVNTTFVNTSVTTTSMNCTAPSAGTKIIMVQGDSDAPLPVYLAPIALCIAIAIIIMQKQQKKA